MRFFNCIAGILCLFAFSCNEQNPAGTSSPGTITGRILNEDSTAASGNLVQIPGTNFLCIVDSFGKYTFYNVPEGSYPIVFSEGSNDTVIDTVIVTAGALVTVQDYINGLGSSHNYIEFNIFTLSGPGDSVYFDGRYSSDTTSIVVTVDTAYINLSYRQRQSSGYSTNPGTSNVIITQNSSVVYNQIAPKGKLATGPILLTGNDTIRVSIGGTMERVIVLLDPALIINNYLFITVGTISISPVTEPDLTSSYYCYTSLNSIWYQIPQTDPDTLDYDIYLVNDVTNDTCYWKRPSPDWGVANEKSDNPVLSGDRYDSYSHSYIPDVLQVSNLSAGTYSLYLHLFDVSPVILSGMPMVNIGFGTLKNYNLFTQFYLISAPGAMVKGSVWYVGKLDATSKTVDQTGQIISVGTLPTAKRRN